MEKKLPNLVWESEGYYYKGREETLTCNSFIVSGEGPIKKPDLRKYELLSTRGVTKYYKLRTFNPKKK